MQRSLHMDRDPQPVALPPLRESQHVGALPPHMHHGAGGSTAPARGVRNWCIDGGLQAVTCPASRMAGKWPRLAWPGCRPREWTVVARATGTRVQQLTPVSRSAAYRPLAARVVKGADCERRGTASAALTVGSRRFVKPRTLAAMVTLVAMV